MTEVPESSGTSETMSPDPQSDAPAPAFRPYATRTVPQRRPRTGLVFVGLSVVVVIGGLVFWSGGSNAEEKDATVRDVKKMTAEELAEDSSPRAAKERVRRMFHGTPAEHAAASGVMSRPRSARLSRNMAMAMALEQQQRANRMRMRVERETRLAEQGY